MKKKIILFSVLMLAVAGGSFYGGYLYSQGKIPKGFSQANLQNFRNRTQGQGVAQIGNRMTGGGVAGEIVKVDNQSLTVKAQDGSSKIVFYSDTTKISKSAEGSKTDLINGTQIIVNGTQNSDGSYTASAIRINDLPK
jgi:hypothetical protein